MGDTIPNCEFMHAHEEIIEKVNASMQRMHSVTLHKYFLAFWLHFPIDYA